MAQRGEALHDRGGRARTPLGLAGHDDLPPVRPRHDRGVPAADGHVLVAEPLLGPRVEHERQLGAAAAFAAGVAAEDPDHAVGQEGVPRAEERRRARCVRTVGHQDGRRFHFLERPGSGAPGRVPQEGAARVGPADAVGGPGLLGGVDLHAFEGEEQHLAGGQQGGVDAEIGGGEELREPAEPRRGKSGVGLLLGGSEGGEALGALLLRVLLGALGVVPPLRVRPGVLLADHGGLVGVRLDPGSALVGLVLSRRGFVADRRGGGGRCGGGERCESGGHGHACGQHGGPPYERTGHGLSLIDGMSIIGKMPDLAGRGAGVAGEGVSRGPFGRPVPSAESFLR